MTGNERQDDARRPGDALDRIIDEAVETALRAESVDLRERVMAAIDGGPDGQRHTWMGGSRRFRLPALLLRPAFLPAVGALMLVAGIATLWERVDQQLSNPVAHSAGHAVSARPRPSRPPEATGSRPPAAAPQVASATPAAPITSPNPATKRPVRTAVRDTRLFAASFLEMDAAAGGGKVTGAALIMSDDDETAEPALPGAPVGKEGDPMAFMPKPRPIVIRPIATPPITEAPPVSTLGKPVGTLTDDAARERQDPGKPGGQSR